jgi:hypothetical protein
MTSDIDALLAGRYPDHNLITGRISQRPAICGKFGTGRVGTHPSKAMAPIRVKRWQTSG